MSALTVLTSEIRQHDGLYSLNDLHKAAGASRKHQPCNFMRVETTTALIEEIQSSDLRSATRSINGGPHRGTYVCKELVYAYATWISPSFHLKVIRAFDALQAPFDSAHGKPQGTPHGTPVPCVQSARLLLGLAAADLAGKRFLLAFADDGAAFSALPLPHDACVMSPRQFADALSAPCGIYVDTPTLSDLIVRATWQLECRVRG